MWSSNNCGASGGAVFMPIRNERMGVVDYGDNSAFNRLPAPPAARQFGLTATWGYPSDIDIFQPVMNAVIGTGDPTLSKGSVYPEISVPLARPSPPPYSAAPKKKKMKWFLCCCGRKQADDDAVNDSLSDNVLQLNAAARIARQKSYRGICVSMASFLRAGLSLQEAAEIVGTSLADVKRDYNGLVRAWIMWDGTNVSYSSITDAMNKIGSLAGVHVEFEADFKRNSDKLANLYNK